jgi:hypothetical protein
MGKEVLLEKVRTKRKLQLGTSGSERNDLGPEQDAEWLSRQDHFGPLNCFHDQPFLREAAKLLQAPRLGRQHPTPDPRLLGNGRPRETPAKLLTTDMLIQVFPNLTIGYLRGLSSPAKFVQSMPTAVAKSITLKVVEAGGKPRHHQVLAISARRGNTMTSADSFRAPGRAQELRRHVGGRCLALVAAFVLASCGGGAASTSGDMLAPSKPSSVSAVAISSTEVRLSWSASTDDTGVASYEVLRGDVPVQRVTAATYLDAGLSSNTAYSYRIIARDAAGNASAPSDQVVARTMNAGTRSCAPYPSMPDLSCVGVPAGTALEVVAGDLATSASGQMIVGKQIEGDIMIRHDNVVISRSRIKGRIYLNGHTGFQLTDVDLGADACPTRSNGGFRLIVGSAGYTLLRSYLHHNADDALVVGGGDPVLIQDSVIANTCYYAGDHLDAVQLYDPGLVAKVTILHSTIDVRPVNSTDKGNAAVFWADRPGAGSQLTIHESVLAGGGYTLAVYDSGLNSGVTIDVKNTRFVRNSYIYGACSLGSEVNASNHSPTVPFNGREGIRWVGNTYDDGTPLLQCQ